METKVIKMYRISNYLYKKRLYSLASIFTHLIRLLFSASIPASCSIGKNTQIKHGGLGVVIHNNAVIGENCTIYQHVTIGGKESSGTPVIGKNVYIGTGACILGNVRIGDGVKIGANSVVIKDVPENSTVVGVPGKILQ